MLLEAQHCQGRNTLAPSDPIAIKIAVYARRYQDVTSLTLEDDPDRPWRCKRMYTKSWDIGVRLSYRGVEQSTAKVYRPRGVQFKRVTLLKKDNSRDVTLNRTLLSRESSVDAVRQDSLKKRELRIIQSALERNLNHSASFAPIGTHVC